jgi:hypothetical protein
VDEAVDAISHGELETRERKLLSCPWLQTGHGQLSVSFLLAAPFAAPVQRQASCDGRTADRRNEVVITKEKDETDSEDRSLRRMALRWWMRRAAKMGRGDA